MRLAANVRRIAKEKGVVLSHLPDFASVNSAHFWFVLSGKRSPTLVWLAKLAKGLDVDVVDLLQPDQQVPRMPT